MFDLADWRTSGSEKLECMEIVPEALTLCPSAQEVCVFTIFAGGKSRRDAKQIYSNNTRQFAHDSSRLTHKTAYTSCAHAYCITRTCPMHKG